MLNIFRILGEKEEEILTGLTLCRSYPDAILVQKRACVATSWLCCKKADKTLESIVSEKVIVSEQSNT